MPRKKIKLFVGASSEAADIVRGFSSTFPRDYYIVHSWDQSPAFKNLVGTFDALLKAARYYDFGLFILTPDDSVTSRSVKHKAPRDNVLFELGLFIGALGPARVSAIRQRLPSSREIKLPSDLCGIQIDYFDNSDRDTLISSVGSLVAPIKDKVDSAGPRPPFSFEAPFAYEKGIFTLDVDPNVVNAHFDVISKQKFLLVAHKVNAAINHDDDPDICMSDLRGVSRNETAIQLKVKTNFGKLKTGEWIEGDLFLVPADFRSKFCKNIGDIKEAGGLRIKRVQIG
jgi:Predicted nucleotide-binding protein containing TIR-like domain